MKASLFKRKFAFIFTKYYILIVIAVVLAILGSGYLMFIKRTVANIQATGTVDLQSKQQERDALYRTRGQLQSLQSKYKAISDDQLQALANVLPRQTDIPFIVIEIKNFVKDCGLELQSIESGSFVSAVKSVNASATTGEAAAPSTRASNINKLNISVTLGGLDSYFKLKDFLDKLSHQLPVMELTSLNYNPAANVYTLNLTTYYQ